MQEIKADSYGIRIMEAKGSFRLARVSSVSSIAANILKQEMLSLGGDAAIARGALTGQVRLTDCLLMGTMAQLSRLGEKLQKQPFGLSRLGTEVLAALENYEKEAFVIVAGRYRLRVGRRTAIMGVVNLTPDSFSADGLYPRFSADYVLRHIEQMVRDGADVIDIGGESTRPGAEPVSVKEELHRTIPVIKTVARKMKVPVSIDTYKPEVARQALDNGASIINDITALADSRMARLAARYKAAVVLMHMKGRPRTMQRKPVYKKDAVTEIAAFLGTAVKRALAAGVAGEGIMIDPGIGFGKSLEDNLDIINRLSEFRSLGRPILIGPSRKSFIGRILGTAPQERVFGTISACMLAIRHGAHIVRVHDVKEVRQACEVLDAIRARSCRSVPN